MCASGKARPLVCALSWVLFAVAGGCQSVLGPTQADTNWRVHDRDHFSFHVRPDSFAERHVDVFGEVLNDQYAITLAKMDVRYGGRIAAYLYDSVADAGFTSGGQGSRFGTAYPRTEAIKATVLPPLDANLLSLLAHEINHVIVQNALGRPGTSFMNEGLASAVLSERHHDLGPRFLHAWANTHRARIPPLARLVDDDEWSRVVQEVAYNASASFLAYLLESYGADPVKQLYYAPSEAFARRFGEIFQQSLEEAEGAWVAYCADLLQAGTGF
jgi:hypothetical protein